MRARMRLRSMALARLALALALVFVGERQVDAPQAPAPTASSVPTSLSTLSTLRWDDTPIDWSRPLPVTPPGGVAEPGYVGSEACKTCHAALYATYSHHSMAATGLRPLASLDARWLGPIFDQGDHNPVRHERSGFSYRPFRKGGRYFVEERMTGPDGTVMQSWVQPVTHSLSAGAYGMAFYFEQGGRYYHLPIDYYAKLGRWDLDPGASKGNYRFTRTLQTSCIACHSDYPRRLAGSDDVFFSPLAPGVGCERCHGPGGEHVRTASRDDIVQPARLSPVRQLDACAQCHEASHDELRADRHDFDYRPGMPLDTVRVSFVRQPSSSDRFDLLDHPERLVRSRCFRESAGKLTCTSCHDPHRSSIEEPATWWNDRCIACHARTACTESPAERAAKGDHCPTCHMRAGVPSTVPQVTITDHWIQRRPPPVKPGPQDTPADVEPWSELVGDPQTGDDLPVLRALAYADVGRGDDTARLVGTFFDRAPHVPRIYRWLGGRFEQQSQPANAARAHAAVLRFEPDSRMSLVAYARNMFNVGTAASETEGLRALDRLLAVDVDNGVALEMKALALVRAGRTDEALPLFERAARVLPSASASHVALASRAMRDGDDAGALMHLEAARSIEPTDVWVLDRLARICAPSSAAQAQELAHARQQLVASEHKLSLTSASRWLPALWR